MDRNNQPECTRTKWREREAYVLRNDLVQLVTLLGGGHLAEFRYLESSGRPTLNPLWVPPWKTIEPYRYRPAIHAAQYGPPATGRMIAGISGHNLCLDYFGGPSDEEAAQGLSIHGEAPSAKWRKTKVGSSARETSLTLAADLPVAGLQFHREIRLRKGESVLYLKETVINQRKADHFFHWTQHVTLGPPFLARDASRITIPATRGRTFPHGYGGKALLASGQDFQWPFAPAESGGRVDLTQPFTQEGLGYVASALLDPQREIEFIAALNQPHRLLVAYCFRREDFPWVAVWEENKARTESPWDGKCQSRGLEFGSTPSPVGRREAFAVAPLFGAPTFSMVPARGQKAVQYLSFLAQVPEDFAELRDIRLAKGEILIQGSGRAQPVAVTATGLEGTGLV